jgi:Ca-activated chloride channel family protein
VARAGPVPAEATLVVFDTSTRRRNPLPLILAVVIGLVAIIAIYLVLKPSGKGAGTPTAARGDCVSLTVAASSEKSALMSELAGRYNTAGRKFGGKCADVKIVSKASGAAMEALATGWDAGRDGGPAPQVWSPASSSWVSLLRQRAASSDRGTLVGDAKPASVAQTPLVLAMPKPMAQALGWPGKQLGWSDVLGLTADPKGWGAVGHPEWGGFRLGKTNPHFSTSGLNATVGAYFAATGRSGDLTEADLPVQPRRGGRTRPGDELHQRGRRRGEVGLRLQPGQPHRRPQARRQGPEAAGTAGRGVPEGRHPALGQPVRGARHRQ